MRSSPLSRRSFLKTASAASAVPSFPAILRSQPAGAGKSPNNKLNIALIGVGGRGRAAVTDLKNEKFVAFCDVDEVRAAQTFKDYPGRTLEWDSAAMKVTNLPEANPYLKKRYRPGFGV